VIGHLVQNAIDATDKDGRVWIRLAKQDGWRWSRSATPARG
jgi:signal transduction histidine kinase